MATTDDADLELRSRHPDDSPQHHIPPSQTEAQPPLPTLKLLSSAFSFFVAGTNDGSLGALIPYILASYSISTSQIALLYLTTFLGWVLAAFTNPLLTLRLSLGSLLLFGSVLQIIPYALRVFHPPFALFALTFFLSGLGQAYQDSHANTYVSGVKAAPHRWLGFIHAMYGLGLLVSPFVATAVASREGEAGRWMLFYLFPGGLSVANAAMVIWAFGTEIQLPQRRPKSEDGPEMRRNGEMEEERSGTMGEVKEMLGMRNLWVFSLFFFFYLGVCFTSAGWVLPYLLTSPSAPPLSKLGYVPSGSYAGIFLGRLILTEPTHRFGEKRMLLIYSAICLALQLVFWLVPNLMSRIVMFSVMGFWLGPCFAAGVSVASKTFPKRIQPAALGMIFLTAQAGAAIFPSLIGVIASRAGVKVLPPIVAGLIVLMGATWALVPKVPEDDEHLE